MTGYVLVVFLVVVVLFFNNNNKKSRAYCLRRLCCCGQSYSANCRLYLARVGNTSTFHAMRNTKIMCWQVVNGSQLPGKELRVVRWEYVQLWEAAVLNGIQKEKGIGKRGGNW